MVSTVSPLAIEKAVLYTRNALHGRTPPEPDQSSIWAQRLYHNSLYRLFYTLVTIGNLLLAWWEPRGPTNNVINDSIDIILTVRIIDSVYLLIVLGDLGLQFLYHGGKAWINRGWIRAKLFVWLCLVTNLALSWTFNDQIPYIARLLRPLLLIERLRNVRKIAGRVAATAPRIVNVGVLLGLHMLLSGVLGYVLFAGTDDTEGTCSATPKRYTPTCSTFNPNGCHDYFANLEEAMIHLFELSTGANFPAIMMPAFKCNPANALYFIFYIVISCYLLLNLTLAVTYSTFREEMKEEVLTKYRRAFAGYDLAFAELMTPGKTRSGTETVKLVDFLVFFTAFRSDVSSDAAERIFNIFDGDQRGEIDRIEFRRLILNFGRIRIRSVTTNSTNSMLTALRASTRNLLQNMNTTTTTASSSSSPSKCRRMLTCLCGKGMVDDNDMDDDEEEDEEVDVFDPTTVVNASTEAFALSTSTATVNNVVNDTVDSDSTSSVSASGTRVVANPLSQLAIQSPTAQPSVSASVRTVRVESMRNSPTLVSSTNLSSLSTGPTLQYVDDQEESPSVIPDTIESWGQPNSSANTSRSKTNVTVTASPPKYSSSMFTDMFDNLRSVLVKGFSDETSTTGYGVSQMFTSSSTGSSTNRTVHTVGLASRTRLPKGIDPYGKRGKLILLLKGLWCNALFDLTVLINAIAGLAQLTLESDDPTPNERAMINQLQIVQYVTLGIFAMEILVKLGAWGPRNFWKESALHRMDIVLVIASLIGALLEAGGIVTKAQASAIMVFRLLRLIRILRALPGFGLTIGALGDILPILGRYVIIIIAVFYSFAIIGMTAFGGILSSNNVAVANTAYGNVDYYALNFDTLPGALLCLFYLLVLNDWPILMEATVAATGTKTSRGYFVSFWIVCVVLCLNVVIAFVIEAYSTEKEKRTLIQQMEDIAAAKALRAAVANTSANTENTLVSPSDQRLNTLAEETVDTGVDDWKKIMRESRVDFNSYHISKMRHHLDIYDTLYREDIRSAYRSTFTQLRKPRTGVGKP